MHDPTKLLLGSPGFSGNDIANESSDPASFVAGVAVRKASTGGLSLAVAAGQWLGISLGRSLSDTKKTAVARTGLKVPVRLAAGPARGVVTITSYANLIATSNDTLKIGATTFTFKGSPSTEDEVGAVTSNNQTATNLATKINNHSVAGLLFKAVAVAAVVTITAYNNNTEGADIDLIYTDTHSADIGLTVDDTTFTGGADAADYVVVGAKVYFSDTNGMADDPNSQASISDAVYASGVLTGIDEDGVEVAAAYVDMPGGL